MMTMLGLPRFPSGFTTVFLSPGATWVTSAFSGLAIQAGCVDDGHVLLAGGVVIRHPPFLVLGVNVCFQRVDGVLVPQRGGAAGSPLSLAALAGVSPAPPRGEPSVPPWV